MKKPLTSAEAKAAISRGQLLPDTEWYEGLMSIVLICLSTLGISAIMFFFPHDIQGRNASLLPVLASTVILYLMLRSWLTERRLTEVVTSRNSAENRQLATAALSELGWQIDSTNRFCLFAFRGNSWFGISVRATILFADQCIYLNIMNMTNFRGRFPFAFGKNARKMRQLVAALSEKASRI